jgi:hypothetical protein
MADKLSSVLSSSYVTEDDIKKRELLSTGLSYKEVYERVITPQLANKYIFNFHGLLKHLVNSVSDDELYYLTKLNGYDSSSDYDGVKLTIRISSNIRS